jgi:hypothetical protein
MVSPEVFFIRVIIDTFPGKLVGQEAFEERELAGLLLYSFWR